MMKKMKKMKKNTNFQKGHKTFRDFQIGHKFWRGKIVHLVKVKGCLTLTNQTLTFVSNLQKRANFIRVIWSFRTFRGDLKKEQTFRGYLELTLSGTSCFFQILQLSNALHSSICMLTLKNITRVI